MLTFILRRLLISVVLLFLISIISFFIITLTPGSPYPWGELNPKITPQVKEAFKKKFHLDRPLHEQYWLNMRDLFSGRLKSIKDDRPVLQRIAERLPATVSLNVLAIFISLTFGLLLGVYAAKHAGKTPRRAHLHSGVRLHCASGFLDFEPGRYRSREIYQCSDSWNTNLRHRISQLSGALAGPFLAHCPSCDWCFRLEASPHSHASYAQA